MLLWRLCYYVIFDVKSIISLLQLCTIREEETKAEIGEEAGEITNNGEAACRAVEECREGEWVCRVEEVWACREEVCKEGVCKVNSKIPSTTPISSGDRVESRCLSGKIKITYSYLQFNSTLTARNAMAQEQSRKEELQFPVETVTGSKEFVLNVMEEV